ncbi:MAG TPA: oligosaccharide flippase family protein [Candidatus Peribacterales bacterium]|nr:oligosaccharide flippase family protein [Candidatus Peribacterales bacterium]
MHSRAIATSTLWQFSSQAVTMILGILSIKFVTTALSQSLVGNYQTVYSYLQIFGILADFGLYAVAVRDLSRAADFRRTFGTLFVLRAIITFLSLGLALLFGFSLPMFSGTPLPYGIAIAIFVPFFTLLSGMLRTLFQVTYSMHSVFLSEVCSKIIPVCLIGLTVFFGVRNSDSISIYYLFLAFGGIGSLTLFLSSIWFAIPLLRKHKVNDRSLPSVCPWFSIDELFRLMRLSAPFGFAFLATTLYRQSDVTLIALLRPDDYDLQNAYYGTVLRLTEIGFLLPTFILNSALPAFNHASEEMKQMMPIFLGKILLSLLVLGSGISLFSYFWARPIILLVAQSAYLSTPLSFGSDTALMLMSFSMFLGMIITFCFYLLLHLERSLPLLVFTSLAAVISVTLNLYLIPLFGFIGAAMTSIFTHLFLATILLIVSLRFIRVSIPFIRLCQWFAFSLALGLSLFFTRTIVHSAFLTMSLGAFILSGACILLYLLQLIPRSILSR